MTIVEQTYQALSPEKREHTAIGYARDTGLYSFFKKYPEDNTTFKELSKIGQLGKSYVKVLEAHEMINFLNSL